MLESISPFAYVHQQEIKGQHVLVRSSETIRGIPYYIYKKWFLPYFFFIYHNIWKKKVGKKTGYRGKDIVQGFVIKLLHNCYILVIILIFYSYYFLHLYYTSYIYYITYPLCVFKRFYTKIPETSKYTKQYKKEYELTQEQKE